MSTTKQPATPRNISEHGTDWDYLQTASDADIQVGIDRDPDAAPSLSREETKARYKLHPPRIKARESV